MRIDDESFKLFFPYGYHLTSKSKIEKIKELGLIPMCGKNSKSVQDYIEAVYFFLKFEQLPYWVWSLFHDNYSDIALIKFETRCIKNIVKGACLQECYTLDKISSEHLYILDSNISPKTHEQKELIWKPLKKN